MNLPTMQIELWKLARTTRRGFTRADLVATVTIASLLAFVMAVRLTAGQTVSHSAACMENLRKLTRAWQQFAVDKQFLAPNPDDGNTIPGFNWVPGGAGLGWSQEFDSDILKDPTRSLLYPYLSEMDTSVFRCPEDMRQGLYEGADPLKVGTRVFAARSYSMNAAVGSNPQAKPAGTPTDGPWLDNAHTHTARNGNWRTYGRLDDIVDPSPSNLAVLVDEDSDSINDGCFGFGMQAEEWIDYPGTRHDTGGVVSFADGRAELRHWVDSRTVITNHVFPNPRVPGSADYAWLRQHISASKALTHVLIVPRPASFGPPAVKLVWPVQTGVTNVVEFSENLASWERLEASIVVGSREASVTDTSTNLPDKRFYRIVPKAP